jgi:NTE family protein
MKRVQLALQGGGAHGAFTWGVLDRLLDDPDIEIGDVSGTSAGALNGAVLVCGLQAGGPPVAKQRLQRLWHDIAAVGAPLTWLLTPLRKPGLGVWDDAAPLLSPYQTNPFAMEPLRRVLAGLVDAQGLNADGPARLHVNAVNARSGACRRFGPGELSIDALLASACAPLMFQAVQIDAEPYWDGSYAANPLLWPLFPPDLQADILLVELTPLLRDELPTTAKNILNRINELASIRGLVDELQLLDRVNRSVAQADLRLHVIGLAESVGEAATEPSIKRTVGLDLFEMLREQGHAACDRWLATHRSALGSESTVDLPSRYLAPYAQPHGLDLPVA